MPTVVGFTPAPSRSRLGGRAVSRPFPKPLYGIVWYVTNAIFRPSGDQQGTLIVPWPP
jgi:hypothetical protein